MGCSLGRLSAQRGSNCPVVGWGPSGRKRLRGWAWVPQTNSTQLSAPFQMRRNLTWYQNLIAVVTRIYDTFFVFARISENITYNIIFKIYLNFFTTFDHTFLRWESQATLLCNWVCRPRRLIKGYAPSYCMYTSGSWVHFYLKELRNQKHSCKSRIFAIVVRKIFL